MRPRTRYARSGDLHIAYQTVGDGPLDVVVVDQWFSNVDAQWDFAPLAEVLTRLSSFSRVIVFDKRGTGLSDPVSIDALPTLEEWIDDMRAVLDAVASERTALVSGIGASLVTLLFAATYPGRTSALALIDPYARVSWAPDYRWGRPLDQLSADLEGLRASWGTQGGLLNVLAPDLLHDRALVEAYLRYERQSASPGAARAMIARLYESDVRHVLPAIRVPALVVSRRDATRIGPVHGRYIADRIPAARYVEVAGNENVIWAGETASILAEVEEFLTGARPAPEPDRVLATILFTDIVESTTRAAELGDTQWRALLDAHHGIVRSALARFRGREIKTTGDGFLATFDGPARAVGCALSIRDELAAAGLAIRSGLHTGEIELIGDDVGGIAVNIAARISAMAGAREVLTSSTVKDLVAGSGLAFEPRGSHRLKGVPDEWRIFAASGSLADRR
ncbi:MAG: adenylate/guanylate cyclase domain-containing protein [Chloroflexota bacterium]|nr:adenylate/guanylate cyclase domain-containing protein [Chloroflexota bacterium]